MQDIKHPENLNWRADYAKLLNTKFSPFLKDRFFSVEAKEGMQTTEVSVLLKNNDESFFYPVQAQMLHKSYSLSSFDSACMLLDFIESYFEEFFASDENVFLPIDLSPFKINEYELMAKGQIFNRFLEKMADSWLESGTPHIH